MSAPRHTFLTSLPPPPPRHIKEHLGAPIDTSKMSEEELQFHYFKMHDADGNNKLDGLELVASLQHWHGEGRLRRGGGDFSLVVVAVMV